MVLRHTLHDRVPLDKRTRTEVLSYVHQLWGYGVRLEGVEADTGEQAYEETSPKPGEEKAS